MKRITDKDFRYTPAAKTDLRKTFARLRREQKATAPAPTPANVTPIAPKKAAK